MAVRTEIGIGPRTAEETLDLLRDVKELPTSFEVIQHALDLLATPGCTNEGLQEILAADASASAGLMKLANSAYFGVAAQVRTPATAIRVVGRRRLEALLRHLLIGKLISLLAAEHPAAEEIRSTAMTAAVVAAKMADGQTGDEPAELQLLGLTHNLGELALLTAAPSDYLNFHERAPCGPAAREATARTQFGLGVAEGDGPTPLRLGLSRRTCGRCTRLADAKGRSAVRALPPCGGKPCDGLGADGPRRRPRPSSARRVRNRRGPRESDPPRGSRRAVGTEEVAAVGTRAQRSCATRGPCAPILIPSTTAKNLLSVLNCANPGSTAV